MPASRRRKSKRRASPYAISPPTNDRIPSKHTQDRKSAQAPHETQNPLPLIPEAALFKVRSCPGRGKGSYATAHISPGMRLVDEPPLFSVSQNNPRAEDIEQELYTLSPPLREQFRALSSGARSPTDYSRFVTNSIQMTGTEQGVFLQTSRFNHSCVPNAYFGFDPTSGCVRIHAIVGIKEGEEITINYGYGGAYRDCKRRNRALRSYGFECDCPACQPRTPKDHAIEPRRRAMGILQGKINRNNSDQRDRVAKRGEHLRSLAELLESAASEGDMMYTALADTYHNLCLWYHSASILAYCDNDFEDERMYMELAVEVAEKKLRLDGLATGDDSLEVAKARIMLEVERRSLARLN